MNLKTFWLNHDLIYSFKDATWEKFLALKPVREMHYRKYWKLQEKAVRKHPNGVRVKFPLFEMTLNLNAATDFGYYQASERKERYLPGLPVLMATHLKRGMTFVDVGANIGFFTLLGSSMVGGSGHVYAFEPTPDTFRRLEQNTKLNRFSQTKCYNCALGSKKSKARLYINALGDNMNSLVFHEKSDKMVDVDVMRLDAIMKKKRVDFLKIDTEGFESDVLLGAKETIRRSKSIKIVIEYNHQILHRSGKDYDTAINFLSESGFVIREILADGLGEKISSHTQLQNVSTDLFCYKEKHLKGEIYPKISQS